MSPSRFAAHRAMLPVSRRRRRVAVVVMLLALAAPVPSHAAGPWQALVVDAETQAPLEGVAVLARWHRRAQGHPAIGLGETGFHSAVETTSGGDGRLRLPARTLFNPPPFFPIEGPEIALFKAGYGGWRFRGPARDLRGADVVIEMRPLATDAEQRSYLEGRWPRADRPALIGWQSGESPANPLDVPYEEAVRYEAAINAARTALGLRPIGIGFPGLWTTRASPTPPESPGQVRLRQAWGIAVDTQGHVYVADTDNHRVVKYGPGLEPLSTWGTFGRADGQLQLPWAITVAGDTVYVADWGNHRIQKFTTDGRFLGKWGELRYNELGGGFTPTAIATTRSGEVVVYAGIVFRFSPSGSLVARWKQSPALNSRSQITVDADGHVYGITGQPGADRPQVVKLSRDGVKLAAWGRQGQGIGELFDPIALAVDHTRRVYVACWGGGTNPRIVVYDAAGTFVHQWDVTSGSLPSLRMPSGLAIDAQGTVYVTDLKRDRPHKLQAPGR